MFPRLVVLLLALAGLAACGAEPPARPAEVRWSRGKVVPGVGSVKAAVVERTGPDRAVIEAHWENLASGEACSLELVLPEGVLLRLGERAPALDPQETGGTFVWEVEHPLEGPLDAVVRFCVATPEGPRASEVAVRLVD